MKKLALGLMSMFFVVASYAQQKRTCHSMENLEYRKKMDPSLQHRMDEIESFTQQKILQKQSYQQRVDGDIITIPVVVHVLYTNTTNNISDAQIASQMQVLNEDFRRTNPDADNTWSQAADTEIEFELATIDPNGNVTTGITRTQVSTSTWLTNDSMKSSGSGGVNPWDTSEYLNMWIVDNLTTTQGGTILGYAQFPGGSASTDGVVMADQFFGTIGTASAPFDGGRTTTHEVGHFLNLRHIWGDGACGVDDFVADTPASDAANYGCTTGHTSCGSVDMVQNYMDYSDDSCMNLFTSGQKDRMRTVLEVGGSRRSLALSDKFGTPCTLAAPSNLNTSGVGDNGFTVSWSAVSGASSYSVTVGSTTTNVTGTSFTATGLATGTQYTVSVSGVCTTGGSGTAATTTVTTTGTAPIVYCNSNGNSVADEYIGNVTIGSINNSTGASSGGYGDYTSITTSLSKSATVNVSITPTWTGTVYSEGYAIFIDYNQDGDFVDSGETVWSAAASTNTPVTGSFVVPTSATDGATRMRVSMKYNGVPTSCESFDYGEVEDYTVVIGAGTSDTSAPTAPTNLTASNVLETSATLSWTASTDNVGVVGYNVYNGSTNTGTTTTTSINITGLSASTLYTFTVTAVDAAGNESVGDTVTFTTDAGASTGCSSSVSSFPYSESFESGAGWTQVTGDDGDWTSNSGSTPSSNTGPSASADGTFYLFLEASTNGSTGQIGADATAILESPCFDLSSETQATFSFQNHMYGTSVGSLALEVSTNGTSWTSIWSLSGDQGNQWNSVSVNLDAYTGNSEVRLRLVGTTGSSWSSDIAVDDLVLSTSGTTDPPNTDCDSIDFNSYSITSFSNQDSDGAFSVATSGDALTLTNNTWKYIDFNYTVTANTVIEFEFSSTSEGEIHGVGFEDDNTLTSTRYFKVYGTQNYGVTNYDNYTSGTVTYTIPVGDSYTGTMDRLVFINDNDGGSGNTSTFTNVKIYETSCAASRTVVEFGARIDDLGLEDEGALSYLTLAPNPVEKGGLLKVLLNTDEDIAGAKYMVTNMLGQTLEKGLLQQEYINTSKFKAGVYILTVSNDYTKISKRFVIK